MNLNPEMKSAFATLCLLTCTAALPAFGQHGDAPNYSQKTLLKNWALSRCLAQVNLERKAVADANASAGAYLEFGRQPLRVYEALDLIVAKYANKRYAGSVRAEFNTMKCIDLFHSKELEDATSKFQALK